MLHAQLLPKKYQTDKRILTRGDATIMSYTNTACAMSRYGTERSCPASIANAQASRDTTYSAAPQVVPPQRAEKSRDEWHTWTVRAWRG